jgi:hypothetical protein
MRAKAPFRRRQAEDISKWKTAFPDPSTSPACHTHTLVLNRPDVVDLAKGGWIHTFSHITSLQFGLSSRGGSEGLDVSPSCVRPSSNPSIFHRPPFYL